MEVTKFYEFFQPEACLERIHIIGCGAIGSTIAENLIRIGLTKLSLYDFDFVESHNIANQIYRDIDIGKLKVDALADILYEINPFLKNDIKIFNEGYTGQPLSGYIFLCIDNIDKRREILRSCKGNEYIKAMFDFRMRLTDAQHYAADWHNKDMVASLENSMDFSHEDALNQTPVSACNMTLSIVPTVRVICALGISNFVNFVKYGRIKKLILSDPFRFQIESY